MESARNIFAERLVKEHLTAIQDRIRKLETIGSGEKDIYEFTVEQLNKRKQRIQELVVENIFQYLEQQKSTKSLNREDVGEEEKVMSVEMCLARIY
jgi:regulator of replication initiation timing